jgi:TetR/AcrR family transcriptional repressor of nem operon
VRRSQKEAAETRQKIVKAASRLFRARGIDAVSVADIMGSLGLTVGGFYRHFASKEALVAEAIDSASRESAAHFEGVAAEPFLRGYLSSEHRDHAERGCPVAALCSEVGHQRRSTKKAFTRSLEGLLQQLATAMPAQEREQILHTAAAAVGALVLARATSDERLSRELMEAVCARVLKEAASRR